MGKNNVVDIDLSVTKKKQFRIDKDDNRIIELNTSDMSILSRLQESYPKLDELSNKAMTLSSEDTLEATVEVLNDIDKEMRQILNFIFDSDIADVCAPDGSMFDMFNGEFRFEHIVSVLVGLYEENIDKEYKLMTKNIRKHTDKYTGK